MKKCVTMTTCVYFTYKQQAIIRNMRQHAAIHHVAAVVLKLQFKTQILKQKGIYCDFIPHNGKDHAMASV